MVLPNHIGQVSSLMWLACLPGLLIKTECDCEPLAEEHGLLLVVIAVQVSSSNKSTFI